MNKIKFITLIVLGTLTVSTLAGDFLILNSWGEKRKPTPDLELLKVEANIIKHTNKIRERAGLQPLVTCPELQEHARKHVKYMAKNKTLKHARTPIFENIAHGQNSSTEVIKDWMSSSGHKKNILRPTVRFIGASCLRAKDGSIYWCQNFSKVKRHNLKYLEPR